jgi:hypothetical protein
VPQAKLERLKGKIEKLKGEIVRFSAIKRGDDEERGQADLRSQPQNANRTLRRNRWTAWSSGSRWQTGQGSPAWKASSRPLRPVWAANCLAIRYSCSQAPCPVCGMGSPANSSCALVQQPPLFRLRRPSESVAGLPASASRLALIPSISATRASSTATMRRRAAACAAGCCAIEHHHPRQRCRSGLAIHPVLSLWFGSALQPVPNAHPGRRGSLIGEHIALQWVNHTR